MFCFSLFVPDICIIVFKLSFDISARTNCDLINVSICDVLKLSYYLLCFNYNSSKSSVNPYETDALKNQTVTCEHFSFKQKKKRIS